MGKLLLAASVCVTALAASSATADTLPAAQPAPQEVATVILYQLNTLALLPPVPAKFYVDGKKVASLVNRSCVSMRMPTGAHMLTEQFGAGLIFYGVGATRPIGGPTVWAAGETYFYRIDSDRDTTHHRFYWRIATPNAAVGAQETAGLKCVVKSGADAGR